MTETSLQRVGPGKQVTLHFAVRLLSGEEVDSNFGGVPATFVFGDGNLLPGFEKALVGLKPGDRRSAVLSPEQAFGPWREENTQWIKRSQFADTLVLEVGTVIAFADKNNAELPGVVKEISEDQVKVDFNHPLAGRDLTFEVHILSVEPYVAEQAVTLQPAGEKR